MENEKRTGVHICHCGLNIAGTVDVEEAAKYAATLPHVVVDRNYRLNCSYLGQELMQEVRY